jgi:uncharacterized protein YecE (DUF72 family)
MPAEVLIGTQGWRYAAWVGPFYPPDSRSSDLLGIYARAFPTVEVDATFYATPPAPVVAEWRDRVPETFRFALKVPQEITHERRLRDAEEPLARFLERASLLGRRLGVLLLQMPPDWEPTYATREALDRFLGSLPGEYRWALEFRDPRWLAAATLDRLRARGVALAAAEGRWIRRDRVLETLAEPTAPFAYLRWMGPDRRLTDFSRVQVDRDEELEIWARAMRGLPARVDTVYGYLNNHFQGHGPASARSLQRLLSQPRVEPATLRAQGELFK